MVVNAPQSNVLSAAEHTMALLLAQARNIPQAHAALEGRPLGALAGGRASSCPTRRSASSGSAASASSSRSERSPSACGSSRTTRSCRAERARQMNVELRRPRRARAQSDFVTIHVAKTKETIGLVGKRAAGQGASRASASSTSARGGIVDEERAGRRHPLGPRGRRRARRVREEPTTESPLFEPRRRRRHARTSAPSTARGAGQGRRHDRRAGGAGARRRLRAVRGERERGRGVRDGASVPAAGRATGPAVHVAGRRRAPPRSRSSTRASSPTTTPASSRCRVLKGVFGGVVDEPVSYVNAPQIAAERGVEVRETPSSTAQRLRQPRHVRGGEPRASPARWSGCGASRGS